jgi:colicin import membrane protein
MQTRILRAATLILLTVMIDRNSFGQIYEDDGNRSFSMNISWAGDDSSRITTVIYKNGPVYVVQMHGDKVLNFSIDGRNIPLDGLGKYQAVLDSIKIRIKEAEEQAKRDRAQAELDRQQAGKDRVQAELDRRQADRDREQAERDRVQAGRDREQAEKDREQAEQDRVRAEEDRKMLDSLIRDLVTDGIVPDRESVHSLKVNADEIVVNGKRLPEAMEKKYIVRYVKKGLSMSIERDGAN